METFLEVLRILFNETKTFNKSNPDETIKFLDNPIKFPYNLDFVSCYYLSVTSKTIYEFMKNIKLLCFNINHDDLYVYSGIGLYGSKFLYYEFDVKAVNRFLKIFGFVYTDIELDDESDYPDYLTEYYQDETADYVYDNFDDLGASPCHVMAKFSDELAILMIESGADLTKLDHAQQSVLHVAISSSYSLTKYLLKSCYIHINQQQFLGYTALHMIANAGGYKACKLLLKHRANPNIQALDERTPIFYAIKHPKIVKLLVDKTDLSIKDDEDMNVMQFCHDILMHPDRYKMHKDDIVKSLAIITEKMQ